MKTFIFFTTLLIFLHTTNHLIGTEAKVGLPDAVLDVDGNPLLSQYIYYVVPSPDGHGPITVLSRQLSLVNKNCTFGVSLGITEAGHPVGFYQLNQIPGAAIRESTDTNIMFSPPTGCNSSGVWKVDGQDPSTGQNFIVTDGVAVTGSANSWFWIEKVEGTDNRYKFRYCPPPPPPPIMCPMCHCSDLDFVGAGLGFLALAETSYPFRFRRYEGHAERY